METDKLFRKIKLAVLLILLLTVVSCSNLPGNEKIRDNLTAVPTSEIRDENPPEDVELIQNPILSDWTEPQEGPTVTAVVLSVEKRGEEGSMIIRTPYPDTFSTSSYSQSPDIVSSIPTAVPGNNNGGLYDQMEVAYFSPMNNVSVLPSQAFHLDVTIRNAGTTTWQTSYKVVDVSEMSMTVQKSYNLPYAVAPGGTAVLSIYIAPPSVIGAYVANFQIQDAYGAVFGRFEYSFYVSDVSYITEIPTLTATITPTYYSPYGITATPDSLAWMCIDPERSKLQDCYSFCVEYSHREEFKYCFYDGQRYTTPVP